MIKEIPSGLPGRVRRSLPLSMCGGAPDARAAAVAPAVDLEVHLEVQLDRKPTIGEYLDKVEWDDQGRAFAVSATDGYLYVHELLDP